MRRGVVVVLRSIEWGGLGIAAAALVAWVVRGALSGGLGEGALAALSLGAGSFVALRLAEIAARGRWTRRLNLAAAAAMLAGIGWAVLAVGHDGVLPLRTSMHTALLLGAACLTGLAAWALLSGGVVRAVPRGDRATAPARGAIACMGGSILATIVFLLDDPRGLDIGAASAGTVGAVLAIATSMLLLVAWGMQKWSGRHAGASVRTIAFSCPRCGHEGTLRVGGDRCAACGLGITVRRA